MTRKRQIQIATAFVVLGGLAIVFWPREEEGDVRVTITSLASNRLSLNITNTFQTSIQYFVTAWHRVETNDVGLPIATGTLTSQSPTNHVLTAPTAGQWRIHLAYLDHGFKSFAIRTRENLADVANDCGLPRLSVWLEPTTKWKVASSPEMLGNKPVPPAQK